MDHNNEGAVLGICTDTPDGYLCLKCVCCLIGRYWNTLYRDWCRLLTPKLVADQVKVNSKVIQWCKSRGQSIENLGQTKFGWEAILLHLLKKQLIFVYWVANKLIIVKEKRGKQSTWPIRSQSSCSTTSESTSIYRRFKQENICEIYLSHVANNYRFILFRKIQLIMTNFWQTY